MVATGFDVSSSVTHIMRRHHEYVCVFPVLKYAQRTRAVFVPTRRVSTSWEESQRQVELHAAAKGLYRRRGEWCIALWPLGEYRQQLLARPNTSHKQQAQPPRHPAKQSQRGEWRRLRQTRRVHPPTTQRGLIQQ